MLTRVEMLVVLLLVVWGFGGGGSNQPSHTREPGPGGAGSLCPRRAGLLGLKVTLREPPFPTPLSSACP